MSVNLSDPNAAKRFIKSLVQGERYDEQDVLRQTNTIPSTDMLRAISVISEELQHELTCLVNGEFEAFVKLFKDIGCMGEDEYEFFEHKLRCITGMVRGLMSSTEKELSTLDELLNKLQRTLAEKKRLQLLYLVKGDLEELDRRLSYEGIGSADLELATEFYVKINNLMNASSGKISFPSNLMDHFVNLSGRFFSQLDDALLVCLRKNSSDEEDDTWPTLTRIYARIGKLQSLINVFRSEVTSKELDKVKMIESIR